MLKRQMIFDFVVLALVAQNRKSTKPGEHGPICAYRGKSGLKCGIGHLIPDDQYEPMIENLGADVDEVFTRIDPKFGNVGYKLSGDESFLTSIQQRLHDNLAEKSKKNEFRDRVIVAAKQYASDEGFRFPKKKIEALINPA